MVLVELLDFIIKGIIAKYDLISSHQAGQVSLEIRNNWIIIRIISAVINTFTISAVGTLLITLILKKEGIQFRVSEEEKKGLELTEH